MLGFRLFVFAATAACASLAGCAYDFDAPFEQPSTREGWDAATEAEAASDASVDAAQDGGKDASADAPADAVIDRPSGADADAMLDGTPEAGQDALYDVQDSGCPSNTKPCNGACVSLNDPATGCAGSSCSPCDLPNATATCNNVGACAVAACSPGHDDCNGTPQDGCETSLVNDPQNCGACGHGCCGGTCDGGSCAAGAITTGNVNASAIANDADAVYWLDQLGTVWRRAKIGSVVDAVCTVDPPDGGVLFGSDGALLIHGQNLYFGFKDGGVYGAPKDATGAQPQVISAPNSENGAILDMTRDGDDLFFTVGSTIHIPGNAYVVNVNTLSKYSVMMSGDDPPSTIAVNPTFVYYLQTSSNTLTEKLRTAPTASNIVNFGRLTDMVVDGSSLYFVDPERGVVGRTTIPIDNSSTEELYENPNSTPVRLTVDSTHAYFTDAGSTPSVGRVAKQSGAFETVAMSQGKPRAITDDDTCVYWATTGSGPVQAVRK